MEASEYKVIILDFILVSTELNPIQRLSFLVIIAGILTWQKHYARSVPWKRFGWILLNGEVRTQEKHICKKKMWQDGTIFSL